MIKMNKFFNWLSIGLVLVFCLAAVGSADAGLFGLFKSKKKAPREINTQSLVIFPFDSSLGAGKVPEGFGDDLATALRSLLADNDQYWIYYYSDRLSPVKRAKEDNELKPLETTGPFTDNIEKCLKLARLLAADYLLSGSVEDYRIDDLHKSAQVTISVNVVSTKTSKVIKTMLVTGRTPEGTSPGEEDEARALAAGDAVAKLKAQLFDDAASADTNSSTTAEKKAPESSPAAMPAVQTAR
jgi:curli biogenesis system outer membrane secretion channel CsgG